MLYSFCTLTMGRIFIAFSISSGVTSEIKVDAIDPETAQAQLDALVLNAAQNFGQN